MTPDRAQLEQRFRDMSDEELLDRAGSGELTDLAVDVLRAEAARRGLTLRALREMDDAEGVEVSPGHGPLKICARYLMPLDAQILAARLQAEGLAARVMDADTIYASGAFLNSLARGGVRVMVPESQLEEALRVRAKFDAGDYAIDENFDPG